MVWLVGCVLAVGCAPASEDQGEKTADDCSVCEECAECQKCRCKMTDLDFFGTYYSSCVEAIRDIKALLDECGQGRVMPDVETCAWRWWNAGERNGTGIYSGCTGYVAQAAWIRSQPPEDQCGYVCGPEDGAEAGSCASCLKVPGDALEEL
jgi:hypothetical protein